jgi:hypothetical protein
VLPLLEMRVWKAEKDRAELLLAEEVGKELHGIGAQTTDVLIGSILCILRSESPNFILDIFSDGHSDFHP